MNRPVNWGHSKTASDRRAQETERRRQGVFGSTMRDQADAASDLDLFVDYDRNGRFSLIELVGIKQLLEERLGVPVDVTTRDSLDPLLRHGSIRVASSPGMSCGT
jgi:uncharacterized protein